MSFKSTFTDVGASNAAGEGPVYYRLSCSTHNSGTVDYFIGYAQQGINRRMAFILTGTWSGQVDIEYSIDKLTWTAIPGESYTANTSRFLNG